MERQRLVVPSIWFEFSERALHDSGYLTLGELEAELLTGEGKRIELDFSETQWSDPQLLLTLLCIVAANTNNTLVLNFGSLHGVSDSQTRFRRHLATQGFLSEALRLGAALSLGGNTYAGKEAIGVIARLTKEKTSYTGRSVSMINYCLVQLDDSTAEYGATEAVEKLIAEALDRAKTCGFMSHRPAKDGVLQKLRKILSELLLNGREHGRKPGETRAYIGVYALVRRPPPGSRATAKLLLDAQSPSSPTSPPQLEEFAAPTASEWIELYVADNGPGIGAHAASWTLSGSDDPDLQADLQQYKQSGGNLGAISHRLFSSPVSRFRQRQGQRTSVTGLLHIGRLLKTYTPGDYVRVYSSGGQWLGGHLPFRRGGAYSPGKRAEFSGRRFANGTAFSFCIRPRPRPDLSPQEWLQPTAAETATIVEALRDASREPNEKELKLAVRDQRTQDGPKEPDVSLISSVQQRQVNTIVLRPHQRFLKIDLGEWITVFGGTATKRPRGTVAAIYFVDLTPLQALILKDLLCELEVHESCRSVFVISTEDWRVCALAHDSQNPGRLRPSSEYTSEFFRAATQDGSGRLNAAALATILRRCDSDAFWEAVVTAKEKCLVQEPVIWPTSDGRIFVLRSYLDIGAALTIPEAASSARRSLRRIFSLLPVNQAVPSDDLIASLVEDLNRERESENDRATNASEVKDKVIVASVSISGQTISGYRNMLGEKVVAEACLLFNGGGICVWSEHCVLPFAAVPAMRPTRLFALSWREQDGSTLGHEIDFALASGEESFDACLVSLRRLTKWERITNTPYVARHGDRHISTLRFRKVEGEDHTSIAYTKPSTMYEELLASDAIRFGHWHYTGRHELFSIHVERAFSVSKQNDGQLYRWLLDNLLEMARGFATSVLIFPSHYASNQIVASLLEDDRLRAAFPRERVISVRFLANKSVSPDRLPPLTEDELHRATKGARRWQAILFDTSTISGKTFGELSQFAMAGGAAKVRTISIIERSIQPYADRMPTEYYEDNRRYWRFDVPPLGHKKECLVCTALHMSGLRRDSTWAHSHKETLARWADEWRLARVSTGWTQNGAMTLPLSKARIVKFGMLPEGIALDKITCFDSTSLASVLCELARLTPRVEKILTVALEFERDSPEIAIQLVASQLFLFSDELIDAYRLKLLAVLGRCLFVAEAPSQWTSMAGLLIVALDAPTKILLWETEILGLIRSRRIGNTDAVVACNALVDVLEARGFDRNTSFSTPPRERIALDNFITLGRSSSLRSALSTLASILSARDERWHSSPLHSALNKITSQRTKTADLREAAHDAVRECELILKELRVLQAYENSMPTVVRNGLEAGIPRLSTTLTNLKVALGRLERDDNTAEGQIREIAAESATQLIHIIYQAGDCVLAMFCSIFPEVRTGGQHTDLIGLFGVGEVLTQRLAAIREAKISAAEESHHVPTARCATSGRFERGFRVYVDTHIRDLIVDLLLNCVHASGQLSIGEALAAFGSSERTSIPTSASMWWTASFVDKFLQIRFINTSRTARVQLQASVGLGRLDAIGGRVEFGPPRTVLREGREEFFIEALLSIPLLDFYLTDV